MEEQTWSNGGKYRAGKWGTKLHWKTKDKKSIEWTHKHVAMKQNQLFIEKMMQCN